MLQGLKTWRLVKAGTKSGDAYAPSAPLPPAHHPLRKTKNTLCTYPHGSRTRFGGFWSYVFCSTTSFSIIQNFESLPTYLSQDQILVNCKTTDSSCRDNLATIKSHFKELQMFAMVNFRDLLIKTKNTL